MGLMPGMGKLVQEANVYEDTFKLFEAMICSTPTCSIEAGVPELHKAITAWRRCSNNTNSVETLPKQY